MGGATAAVVVTKLPLNDDKPRAPFHGVRRRCVRSYAREIAATDAVRCLLLFEQYAARRRHKRDDEKEHQKAEAGEHNSHLLAFSHTISLKLEPYGLQRLESGP